MNTLRSRSERAAAIALAIAVIAGFVAILLHLGSFYWFHGDEWVFLTRRMSGSLLQPHNEHLAVVPILVYRLLFALGSIESYTLYQIPVLTAHLGTAVLLWLIMRRCEVNPWIATALATVFIFFGPGEENIIWAFQVGFTGALFLGLAQLLLADHEGGHGARDAAGLALGLGALLSAGFTPVLVAATGAVALVRRGWGPALFHTVPLAIVYLSWWLAVGPESIGDPYGRAMDPGAVLHFVYTAYRGVFLGLAGFPALAAVYCAGLGMGLVAAYARMPPAEVLRRAVLPLGLLGAGLFLVAVAGYSRWWISDDAGAQSRYLHLATALTLPAFAVAIDALTRWWKPAVIAACLLLISVLPANIAQFGNQPLSTKNTLRSASGCLCLSPTRRTHSRSLRKPARIPYS
ncbi:MAG: hypothetical protein U5K56_13735 [Halioglobus sp.]|nr:hypothetical protein [Halioglobus sp.]